MANITWTNPNLITASQVTAANVLLDYAGSYINSFLARPISWDIQIGIDPSVPYTAASWDTKFVERIGPQSLYYSPGQYQAITGTETSGFDSIIRIIPAYVTTTFIDPTPATSDDIPPDSRDTLAIFTKQILHGLAFNGWTDINTYANATASASPFDLHIVNRNGQPYFSGTNVNGVYGGEVPLTSRNPFHLGNFTGPGSELSEDPMFVSNVGGRTRKITDLDLAILADLGIGTIRNDILVGTNVADNIAAGAGDDIVTGGIGDDLIDGGTGINTSVYTGAARNYKVVVGPSVTVQARSGTDGTDTLTNTQLLKFADQTVDTATFSKTAELSASQIASVVEVYIASFNRAPDALGLAYWGSVLKDGMSLVAIARSFFTQPETIAKYPWSMSNTDFVTTVYSNVLGRAPDAAGLNYWAGELALGHASRNTFLVAIIEGARANTGAGADIAVLNNKVTVGEHFALGQGLSNADWAHQVMAGVTASPASVSAANAQTDGFAAIAAAPATNELVVQIVGITG